MSETKQKHMETFGQSLTVRYDTIVPVCMTLTVLYKLGQILFC